MAIYHFSVKTISRAHGRSAVAAAAYRSGTQLNDNYYGVSHDYRRKSGVEFTKIYVPRNANKNLEDREYLWNLAEHTEKRKNATVAREFEIAFPAELNKQQRQSMLEDLCLQIVEKHKVAVDACIHAPHKREMDKRNYHAHLLLTTRAVTPQGLGEKTRELDEIYGNAVKDWRRCFAEITNYHLKQAGYNTTVDHRSLKEQGLSHQACLHEGATVTALRREGKINDRIVYNNLITEKNRLQQEIAADERAMQSLKQSHTTYLEFQKIYESFIDECQNNNSIVIRDGLVDQYDLVQKVKQFEQAAEFLQKYDLEPKATKPSFLSFWKKGKAPGPLITLDELDAFKNIYLEPVFSYRKNRQKEKIEQEKQRKRQQEQEIRFQLQQENELNEVARYFKNYDQTGLQREFTRAFRYPHNELNEIETRTQFQAQDFVRKDYESFEENTKLKYKAILALIPQLDRNELRIVEKIIATDHSVPINGIQRYTAQATQAIREKIEDMQWRASQRDEASTELKPSKQPESIRDFDF